MNHISIISLLSLLILASCKKDKPDPIVNNTYIGPSKKVYVINEGNYGSNNAGITLFDTGTGNSITDKFKDKNGVALGDVAQSMSLINGDYYIVVNNSNKIVVCDTALKIKRTISGLTSPRYIIGVSAQKAYVSDYYANGLSIVDLNTGTKTGSITLHGSTEKMVYINNKVYVTNSSKDHVYVINTTNNSISDSISVGLNASHIVLDKNNKIWVLSSGTSSVQGKLSLIDPFSNSVTWSQSFALNDKASLLCLNGTKDTLWYANKDGICRMPIKSTILPNAFITSTSNIYGLGIHPTRHEVYVADAIDYVSQSKIFVYKASSGTYFGSFKAGFISNGFYFE
jgi:YVTN family beta-propeller protein